MPAEPVSNLAAELLANRNLLSALAGPGIALTVDAEGGAQGVRLAAEDLTRVLVNLVKNAAEAMPGGGRIQIGLGELPAGEGAAGWLAVTVEDNGPGIPGDALEKIFESGYTTRAANTAVIGSWPVSHRGLGLAICRSLVEGAGGRLVAPIAPRAERGSRSSCRCGCADRLPAPALKAAKGARARTPDIGGRRRSQGRAAGRGNGNFTESTMRRIQC